MFIFRMRHGKIPSPHHIHIMVISGRMKRKSAFVSHLKAKILFFIADGIILNKEALTAPTLRLLCDGRADVLVGSRGAEETADVIMQKGSSFLFTLFNPGKEHTLLLKPECAVLASLTHIQLK